MDVNIKAYYGGEWNGRRYKDGNEVEFMWTESDLTYYGLRYQVARNCYLVGSDFDMFYFSLSESTGRTRKSKLRSNEQVAELCTKYLSPEVYVIMKNGGSSSSQVGASSSHVGASSSHVGGSSSYIPQFDPSYQEPSSFQFGSTYGNTENLYSQLDHIVENINSTDWDEQVYQVHNLGGSSSHRAADARDDQIPDLNYTSGRDEQEDPNEDDVLRDDDDDEDEYEPELDVSTEDSDQSNVWGEGRQIPRALMAEWTAWIAEEGGFNRLLGMMFPDLHCRSQPPLDRDTEHMRNWLVPVVPLRAFESAVFNEEDASNLELRYGAYFKSKEDLYTAVGLWQMESRKNFYANKSDKKRLVFRCTSDEKCLFNIRAISSRGNWVISVFDPEHTCGPNTGRVERKKVRSKVIASYFAKRILRDSAIMKPRIIENELLTSFGIKASYNVCLRARNQAVEIIYGKHKESFQDLPAYLHALETSNAGTVTDLDIDDECKFRHVFVALAASIAAYKYGHIRPVISVDGTHLKGKNTGVMLVAVAKDANEQLFPLAYGVGRKENHASWTWFMRGLRRAYGNLTGVLIVSDQHVSIEYAVAQVFPEAHHGLCYYHLSQHMTYGMVIGAMFQRAAYTYDQREFHSIMASMLNTNPEAYEKAMGNGPARWARSMCPVRRFSTLTSNAAESFNNSLLWARRLPIVACLDAAKLVIEKWFDERRLKARNDTHPICEEARRKIGVQLEMSHRYKVTRISLDVPHFRVQTLENVYHVDLKNMLCDCNRWQFDCIPCAHSIAAMMENGQAVEQYIAHYYRRDTYAKIYNRQIFPVPTKEEWTVPSAYLGVPILPNPYERPAGRPSERRRRGGRERTIRRAPRRCRQCGEQHGARQPCANQYD